MKHSSTCQMSSVDFRLEFMSYENVFRYVSPKTPQCCERISKSMLNETQKGLRSSAAAARLWRCMCEGALLVLTWCSTMIRFRDNRPRNHRCAYRLIAGACSSCCSSRKPSLIVKTHSQIYWEQLSCVSSRSITEFYNFPSDNEPRDANMGRKDREVVDLLLRAPAKRGDTCSCLQGPPV